VRRSDVGRSYSVVSREAQQSGGRRRPLLLLMADLPTSTTQDHYSTFNEIHSSDPQMQGQGNKT
jgi:hypothetical protein